MPLWAFLVISGPALQLALIFAFASVVGEVSATAQGGLHSPAGHRLIEAALVVGGLFFALRAADHFARALDSILGWKVEAMLQARVINAVNAPEGIAHLEESSLRDAVAQAREIETAVRGPGEGVGAVRTILTGGLTGIAAAVVLAGFRWWAPLVLVVGWALQDFWGHGIHGTHASNQRQYEFVRRYEYFRSLAFEPSAAKESRIFGLAEWLSDAAHRHWQKGMVVVWSRRRVSRFLVIGIFVSQLVANTAVFTLVARSAIHGQISIRQVAVYLQAGIWPLTNLLQPYAMMILRTVAVPIRHALELKGRVVAAPTLVSGSGSAEGLPRAEIRLDGVGFRYPGTEHVVMNGLTLSIPAGRSLAIVGANGSGKTTLVKLLTRLYDPDEGTISVDGADLRTLSVDAWRCRVAVIFQDFVRYPLSLRENVGFGSLSNIGDEAALTFAAAGARIEQVLANVGGWETILSREFGGSDLSGGQWQRVALARALFAVRNGANLLILDEPTANLDVRAEAELFDRFLDLTQGLTTILISHRFSTIRHADRICVLGGGQVVEEGSHAELLERGGLYARMFKLQASHFDDQELVDA